MISPGNATPLTVCIYGRKVGCQPLLQIAFDSIGGSVLSFPRRTNSPPANATGGPLAAPRVRRTGGGLYIR